jgi:hypothetical protein
MATVKRTAPQEHPFEPTDAQLAAAVIMGTGKTDYMGVGIQTTHRFRLLDFFAIENMATKAGLRRAEMINLVVAAGLCAIRDALPSEHDFRYITPEQVERMDKLYPGTAQTARAIAASNHSNTKEN